MINQRLFSLLEQRFGVGRVKVMRENEPFVGKLQKFKNDDGTISRRWKRTGPSEDFLVNCPFCHDTKQRLSINHLWGVDDKRTDSLNLWLMRCYNEECQEDYGNRVELYRTLVDNYGIGEIDPNDCVTKDQQRKVTYKGKVQMPRRLLRVSSLVRPGYKPHKAVKYLLDRYYDPIELGERFGVGYAADDSQAEGRIVAPVYCNGLKGWSARFIGDPPDGVRKWIHAKNMLTSELVYNYDTAKEKQTKIVVEGPGDVWAAGSCGMGMFGKSISPGKAKLLAASHTGNNDVFVLMLDPKQNEKEEHRRHHMLVAADVLRGQRVLKDAVLPVMLPLHMDPGDTDRYWMYDYIEHMANKVGKKVTFED